jgi:hypothetical protein
MRFPTRLASGLLVTALAAPLTADAVAQQTGAGGYPAPVATSLDHSHGGSFQPGVAVAAPAPVANHSHKGLMGWRHCTECQRARAKARDGVDVPPPPSMPGQGGIVHQGHSHGSTGCAACDAGAVIVTETYPDGQVVSNDVATASNMPAGHAVVGPDPAPVGVSRASQGNFTPYGAMAAGGPRTAQRDPSVMPTSMIPAQTAVGGAEGSRPRIISHLLGLPDLRRLRHKSEAYKGREHHAAISYGEGIGPVSELPASMVYGKDR